VAVTDPFTRPMLRWLAALVDATRTPATIVAIGDSLVVAGAFDGAIDALFRRCNPVVPSKHVQGFGWCNGASLAGDGEAAASGGFDGAPRHMRSGDRCRLRRLATTSAVVHGTGPVRVRVNGTGAGHGELAVDRPLRLDPAAFGPSENVLEIEATGPATVHGVQSFAANEQRGIRYYGIGASGRTARFFLDETDAVGHIGHLSPDLILSELAINDVKQHGPVRFADDLDELFVALRQASPRTSIVYWFPHRPGGIDADTWAEAHRRATTVCRAHDVVLIDGHALMGSTADADDTEGLTVDSVHYSDRGAQLCSAAVLSVLAPGIDVTGPALTAAQLPAGSFLAGAGDGDAAPVAPPPGGYTVLQGTTPNVLTATGLFFSAATYLSAIDDPPPPPPDSVALFVRRSAGGPLEVCARFPDGRVVALGTDA